MTEGFRGEMDKQLDPHDLGWQAGYDDEPPDCPYEEGTEEAKEWWEGYWEGSNDC